MIEQHNPDVEFDWTRILKGQPDPHPSGEVQGRTDAARRDRMPRRPEQESVSTPPPPHPEPSLEAAATPAADVGPDTDLEPEDLPMPPVEFPPSAALARLGPEGLSRLRARYAEVLARISERIADPARQEELKTMAERLNPDTWVTDAEVGRGLDEYETTFEALRAVVGRPRRRRRRRRIPNDERGTPNDMPDVVKNTEN